MTTPKLAPVARVEEDGIRRLLAALHNARALFGPIKKAKENPHFRSKYAAYDDIMEAIGPALAAEGLTITHSINAEVGRLETTLWHDESGEALMSSFPLPDVADPQKIGASVTYGRRFNVTCLLDLCADEDDDGQRAAPRRTEGGRSEGSGGSRAGNGSSSAAKAKFWKALREEFATENPWKSHGARRLMQLVFSTTDASTIKALSDDVFVSALNHPETGWKASLEKVRAEDRGDIKAAMDALDRSDREPGEEGDGGDLG